MNINKLKAALPKSAPLHVLISITSDCNLRCIHCYGTYGLVKNELPFSYLKKILLYLKKQNIIYVNISGGEPTKYSNFENLIDYLDYIELPYCLTTNGLFSNELFNKIDNSKMLLSIKISLDGITPATHLFIRDPKKRNKIIFTKAIDAIKKFTTENIFVAVGTLVHSNNYNKLLKYPKYLHYLGVKKWVIGPLLKKGRGQINELNINSNNIFKLFSNTEFVNELTKLCNLYNIDLDISDFKRIDGKKYVFECGAGIHYYHISTSRIAYPCPLIEYTIFKSDFGVELRTPKDIIKVWQSRQFKNWRKQQIIGCPNCKLRNDCSRCPIQLDILGKSIYEDIDYCLVN